MRSLLLIATALAVGCAAQSTLHILDAPKSVSFDQFAGAIDASSLSALAANLLGVNKDLTWRGLSINNIFSKPKAVVTISVPSNTPVTVPHEVASFPITHTQTSLSDVKALLENDLISALASIFPKTSVVSSAGSLATTDAEALYQSINICPSVSYNKDTKTFTITLDDGTTLSLPAIATAEHDVTEFLVEIFSTLHAVLAIQPTSSDVFAHQFSMNTLQATLNMNPSAASPAIFKMFDCFVHAVHNALNNAFPGSHVLLLANVLPDSANAIASRKHTVSSRSIVGDASSSAAPIYSMSQVAYVPNCAPQAYTCYCYASPNGTMYDPDSGCLPGINKDTLIPGVPVECSWHPCSCSSPYVVQSQSRCSACAPGFILSDNICYKNSNYPMLVNIVLWLFSGLILAIIATSVVLGGMDPGRNSPIYRLTSQRPKTQ